MKHINHIFFDLDHTLWDFEKNSDIAFKNIFTKHNVQVDIRAFLQVYKPINQLYWKLYREERISKSELRYGRLKDAFDKISYTVSNELIDMLSHDYIEELPNNNYLFDGTHEILGYLQQKYQLHIITNGFNEVQFRKIKNANLEPYFTKIITSEEVGVKKPNPKIFEYALESANASKKESIMIGDNWEADVMGAIEHGMDAIFFNAENDRVAENIKSVTKLIDLKNFFT